jgi:hypothetical protein
MLISRIDWSQTRYTSILLKTLSKYQEARDTLIPVTPYGGISNSSRPKDKGLRDLYIAVISRESGEP